MLASCLGEEGSAVAEVVRGKEDKGCILSGTGGVCVSEQVEVD